MKRIVVKVGSSTLTEPSGRLDSEYIRNLASQICTLRKQGTDVVLVTSGAVRAGVERLSLACKPHTIPEKQAVAAVGQGLLMSTYHDLFSHFNQPVGQVLLTREDIANRGRYLNARNTLLTLLHLGIVPIVNENDTVAVDEIKFGDNDTLAALVGMVVEADEVILLTDVEGLYRDPDDPEQKVIPVINRITKEIETLAGGTDNEVGTGGMITKIRAARIAMNSGIPLVICSGRRSKILLDIAAGKPIGTYFTPRPQHLNARQRWIAFGTSIRGTLKVNDGAREAILKQGTSLLPAGILEATGNYKAGDRVRIIDETGKEFARGLSNYNGVETRAIKGLQTSQIETILGHRGFDEVVHRDNMVIGIN